MRHWTPWRWMIIMGQATGWFRLCNAFGDNASRERYISRFCVIQMVDACILLWGACLFYPWHQKKLGWLAKDLFGRDFRWYENVFLHLPWLFCLIAGCFARESWMPTNSKEPIAKRRTTIRHTASVFAFYFRTGRWRIAVHLDICVFFKSCAEWTLPSLLLRVWLASSVNIAIR